MFFGGTEQQKLAFEDYHRGLADPDFCPNVVYNDGHHPECLCEACFPSDDDPADLLDPAVPEPAAHGVDRSAFADEVPF